MKRIAIVGGGISGLVAAYALERRRNQGAELEYVLFEASPRFGGVIRTEHVDDCVVEAGPDSFLTEKPWAADLCRELGLGDDLISSNDAERQTYILVKGKLLPLPDGLTFMVPTKLAATFFSPLFSWTTKLRMIREWFYPPSPDAPETTVADFVERHYGREMVDRVADPLLAGVYGGSVDELSATSVLPRFTAIEAKQGSLGRAMLAARRLQRPSTERGSAHQTVGRKPSLFTSLKSGMRQMTDALLAQIPESAQRMSAAIEVVRPEFGKWLVVSAGRTEEFDAVIMALPAYTAAKLLRRSPDLCSELNAIRYSSSVTVVLGFDAKAHALLSLPPGFGFLVPRTEGKRILACTFVHNKFPHRAPENHALIRCFLGGSRDEAVLRLSDADIGSIVRRELGEILAIDSSVEPGFVRIYKWSNAMAQYGIGHRARVERIRKLTSTMRGLALAGNAYAGIGVPDCVRSGSEAVSKVMADLSIMQPQAQSAG
jgi:oxygen-dependent protoporphyrinogen oxidase